MRSSAVTSFCVRQLHVLQSIFYSFYMRGEKRIFRGGTTVRAVGKDGAGVRFLLPEGSHPPSPQPAHLHALLLLHRRTRTGRRKQGRTPLPSPWPC